MEKLERMLAALEVEAAMAESHGEKLLFTASSVEDPERQRELLQLAAEEKRSAEVIRLQIRLLRDHLGEDHLPAA